MRDRFSFSKAISKPTGKKNIYIYISDTCCKRNTLQRNVVDETIEFTMTDTSRVKNLFTDDQ